VTTLLIPVILLSIGGMHAPALAGDPALDHLRSWAARNPFEFTSNECLNVRLTLKRRQA
jgi:hypothetical protein